MTIAAQWYMNFCVFCMLLYLTPTSAAWWVLLIGAIISMTGYVLTK